MWLYVSSSADTVVQIGGACSLRALKVDTVPQLNSSAGRGIKRMTTRHSSTDVGINEHGSKQLQLQARIHPAPAADMRTGCAHVFFGFFCVLGACDRCVDCQSTHEANNPQRGSRQQSLQLGGQLRDSQPCSKPRVKSGTSNATTSSSAPPLTHSRWHKKQCSL